MKQFILISTIALSFYACTTAESTEESLNEEQIEEVVNEEIESLTEGVDYANDWEMFKSVIEKSDSAGVNMYCSESILEPNLLIDILKDPEVFEVMEKTKFEELEQYAKDGNDIVEFFAGDLGEEDGGSSITLLFFKLEEGLMLEGYILAG